MSLNGTTASVSELPPCDFCGAIAIYDGKTIHGPWAFMCSEDFEKFGPGRLGTGWAQRLLLSA